VSREIVVSEADKIAVVLEDGVVSEFFLSEGEQFVGDIILASVESIVPAIEAAFLDIGREKSGFIHVSDLPASKKQQSGIRQFLKPQQTLLVQVTREPTGNKGACLSGFISLPGRFLVMTPFERRIGLSKRIYDARERARLSRIARMICGSGYGIVLRPEAVGQSEQTLREDLKLLLARWKQILAQSEKSSAPTTLYRDQDVLERILREGMSTSVSRIIVDSQGTYDRAIKYFNNWSDTQARSKLRIYNGSAPIMSYYGVYQQMELAIQPLVQLPSGGTLVIQPTEALTSIDVNTSSMTSTDNQPETILRTNCEAAIEIARQLQLRDIGGVIVIDFIDMDSPRDQQIVWQKLADALQHDKAQPQINYFSEFGLVEMTRRRQRQRLSEMLTSPCPTCLGVGRIRNLLYRADILTSEGMKGRLPLVSPAEKSSRYKNAVEKPQIQPPPTREPREIREPAREQEPVSHKEVREPREPREAREPREPRENREGRGKHHHQAAAAAAPLPIEEEIFETAPVQKKEKVAEIERLEDLLFDASYFTAELTDEFLEQFIEREDNLSISSKVSSSLDQLVAQIDEQGIQSIRVTLAPNARHQEERWEQEEEALDAEITNLIESDEADDVDAPYPNGHEQEDVAVVEEAVEEPTPAPVSKPSRRGRKPAPEPVVVETVVAEPEPVVEEVPAAAHEEVAEDAEDAEGADDAENVDGAEEAATDKKKPARKLLARRRTIRSFRPKK
jgi:ribonuclease E